MTGRSEWAGVPCDDPAERHHRNYDERETWPDDRPDRAEIAALRRDLADVERAERRTERGAA